MYLSIRRRFLVPLLVVVAMLGAVAPAAAGPEQPEQITLRVQTPSYHLDGDGLRVEGYATHATPGAPALPVWSTLVELPAEGQWQSAYESSSQQLLAVPVALPAVPVPDLDLNRPDSWTSQLDLPGSVPLVARPDPSIYATDAFYPASPVMVGPELIQRGRRLLPVSVFPFQVNPVSGQLRYHPDLQITISINPAAAPAAAALESALAAGQQPSAEQGAVRIYTGRGGLYRLTYGDLQAAGVPIGSLNPATFSMTYLGQPVDILVTGSDDGRFDPGDLVVFFAETYQGRYSTRNVYRLAYGGATGGRMQRREVPPTGSEPLVTTIFQTARVEFDRIYYSTYPLPRDVDHFFDNPLSVNSQAPTARVTYELVLDDLAPEALSIPPSDHSLSYPESSTATIRARLHGGQSQAAAPDQSVALQVNGQPAGVFAWDGSIPYVAQATVPAAWLSTSPSRVTLEAGLARLPGVASYWVSPDWVEITYPARADAENDQIAIEGLAVTGQRAQVAVTGFTTSAVRVLDVRNPLRPVQLGTVQAEATGGSHTIRFWDSWQAGDPAPRYVLSSDAGLLAPKAVAADRPSSWRSPNHRADYIAIVHRSLWDAVQPLLDHRAAEGLRVARVDVQDIYDEFSFGRMDPEAIRSFLAYAYRNWNAGQAPPQYVLLVGDGHVDFKGAVAPNLPNLIPPYLLHVDPFIGETAADNRYVSVDGPNDYMPDLALGRIPAKTPTDVTAVVDKVIAYERSAPAGDWQRRAVFVADNNADPAGNFHRLSDAVRLALPPGTESRAIYYNMDGAHDSGPEMRAAIKAAFAEGALVMQWYGHASRFRWGSIDVFNTLDPVTLAPGPGLPFTAHYTCWSGYFIGTQSIATYNNDERSLGEVLLLTPGRGAVADLSPTGLHIGGSLLGLDQGLARAIFQDRTARAGLAVNAAKAYFIASGSGSHDIVDTTVFLGDPALRLRVASGGRLYLPLVMARWNEVPQSLPAYQPTIELSPEPH
jgi:hypothetical protein